MSAAAVLRSVNSDMPHPVLEDLHFHAEIHDLLSVVTLRQAYRNTGSESIEAIYTFPLPRKAVLLEMNVQINGKTLRGVVKGSAEAEDTYDDQVGQGHLGFLLEELEPGLFAINVGNLARGESAELTFKWGQLMRWSDRSVELRLPTVPSDRYGDPRDAGMDARTVPNRKVAQPIRFSMDCKISGVLAGVSWKSPSHNFEAELDGSCLTLKMIGNRAIADRDVVLTFNAPDRPQAGFFLANDGGKRLVVTRFQPQFSKNFTPRDRNLVILLDCSSSMQGDSIMQAHHALGRTLDELNEKDRFAVVRYGSHVDFIQPKLVNVTRNEIERTRERVSKTQADLGGSNLASALAHIRGMADERHTQVDVLLITNGHVTLSNNTVHNVRRSNSRFFVIGVGSNITESTSQLLAEVSGGFSESVAPLDDVDEKVTRMVRRIREVPEASTEIEWPGEPIETLCGLGSSAFSGDTVYAFAWYSKPISGPVRMACRSLGQDADLQEVFIEEMADEVSIAESEIARVIAAERMRNLPSTDEGRDQGYHLSKRYQLVSPWTSYIAVLQRDEGDELDGMPLVRRVPQSYPAGDHGFGTVMQTDRRIRMVGGVAQPSPKTSYAPEVLYSRSRPGTSAEKGAFYEKGMAEKGALYGKGIAEIDYREFLLEFAEQVELDFEQAEAVLLYSVVNNTDLEGDHRKSWGRRLGQVLRKIYPNTAYPKESIRYLLLGIPREQRNELDRYVRENLVSLPVGYFASTGSTVELDRELIERLKILQEELQECGVELDVYLRFKGSFGQNIDLARRERALHVLSDLFHENFRVEYGFAAPPDFNEG